MLHWHLKVSIALQECENITYFEDRSGWWEIISVQCMFSVGAIENSRLVLKELILLAD